MIKHILIVCLFLVTLSTAQTVAVKIKPVSEGPSTDTAIGIYTDMISAIDEAHLATPNDTIGVILWIEVSIPHQFYIRYDVAYGIWHRNRDMKESYNWYQTNIFKVLEREQMMRSMLVDLLNRVDDMNDYLSNRHKR